MAYVSDFREGTSEERDLLGGKGAGLAEMTRLGLPVPPGFTITTAACRAYLRSGGTVPIGLSVEVERAVARLEEQRGRRLGDPSDPLLLSVRSGAPVSMPGMMDTVLNLGLTTDTVKGLVELTGDPRFAYDAYRRFLEMFGRIVLEVPTERMEEARTRVAETRHTAATALDADGLHDLCQEYATVIRAHSGHAVPEDPHQQLSMAIEAVFRSWNGKRARDYRHLEGIPDDLGTAVNVQAMVFGNTGQDSGTGVAFTRDPATGDPAAYGDFLVDAQGEDVVAGIRATAPLADMAKRFPEAAADLHGVLDTLERHYRDMCDIEFTVEHRRLFVLQTRVGKRTAAAAVRMATDMVDEGLIAREEAVRRVSPTSLEQLLHPRFAPDHGQVPIATGLNASPGAAVGAIVLTPDDAVAAAASGDPVVLVRTDTSPDDLHGMVAAEAILTARGGLVSHAAVVARGIGKPAVCGAGDIDVHLDRGEISIGEDVYPAGTVISVDGTSGEVFLGALPLIEPEPAGDLDQLLAWADQLATVEVLANADTPEDAARARTLGAKGIGLCRTEHQFLGQRVDIVRQVILADDPVAEAAALDELHDAQVEDFVGVLAEMDGLPVTVRLLDAPMHEFLPDLELLRAAQDRGELDADGAATLAAAERWEEQNPMLGVRGCRLGLLKPHLYEAQTRALADAISRRLEDGGDPRVQVMIPLVAAAAELGQLRELISDVLEEALGVEEAMAVAIGTMIETPRAALTAGEIAQHADFFSFGTNDLTQMTFGFSRDDVEERILGTYRERGLLTTSPFQELDTLGVGRLVLMATMEGRAARPDLEVGLCGEHGGDPRSIAFLARAGLDHVSCSPFRLPIARLAAAHAELTG